MRSSPRRLAAACLLPIFVVLLLSAPAKASRTDCSPEPAWPGQDAASAAEVVRLVNAYRAARGLSQLTMSQSLTNAAAWKASELAVDVPATGGAAFSHSDYGTDRTPEARLQTCGYGDAFGENIALGQASPQAVMDAWINSAGHRANLEYPAWTAIGVGAAGGQLGLRLGAGLRRLQPRSDRHAAGEPRPHTVDDRADPRGAAGEPAGGARRGAGRRGRPGRRRARTSRSWPGPDPARDSARRASAG